MSDTKLPNWERDKMDTTTILSMMRLYKKYPKWFIETAKDELVKILWESL